MRALIFTHFLMISSMKKVFVAGLIASIAMAMVEMIYEGIWGVGFWSAPVFIAATVLRDLQAVPIPVSFALVPVLVGLAGHMMNSVILGMIFVMLLGKHLTTRIQGVSYGVMYAIIVFLLMWFAVLPAIDPVMRALNPFVFVLAHIVWGAVLGFMVPIAFHSRKEETAKAAL